MAFVLKCAVHPDGRSSGSAPVIVAIIPARYQSSRFPGKALALLDGRPLIEHVYRRTSQVRAIARVLVATDDDRIRQAVEGFGGAAIMTSPRHPSGTDRLAEVARHLDCDIVVNVQGDEPAIEPAMIECALEPFRDPTVVMGTVRRRLSSPDELSNPHVVKVVVDGNGDALYFSRAPIPWARDADGHFAPGATFKHIGLYVYRREFLLTFASLAATPLEQAESLEQLRALEHGFRIRTVETPYDSVGVDTPDDLERVRERFEGRSS